MPPKKQAAASVVKGGSVSDAPAEDFDGATFTLTIEAQAHNFTELTKTAYDSRFSFHFFGADALETTESLVDWETKLYTKKFQRTIDTDFLLVLEKEPSFKVLVEQRSCPANLPEGEAAPPTAGKGATKGGKKPPPKKALPSKGKEEVEVEDGPKFPLDDIREAEFSQILEFFVNVCSFFIDTVPVEVAFGPGKRKPPAGLDSLKVTVSIEKPLLTPQQSRELLPVELTVGGAYGLPAIPYQYKKMASYYQPVRASFKFYNQPSSEVLRESQSSGTESKLERKPSVAVPDFELQAPVDGSDIGEEGKEQDQGEGELAPDMDDLEPPLRHVKLPSMEHSAETVWNHRIVILLGRLNLPGMASYLQDHPLVLEIRDRDLSAEGAAKIEEEKWVAYPLAKRLMVSHLLTPTGEKVEKPEDVVEEHDEVPTPAKGKGGKTKGKDAKGAKDATKGGKNVVSDAENEARDKQVAALAKEQEEIAMKGNLYGLASFSMMDLFRGSYEFSLTSSITPVFPPRGSTFSNQVKINPYPEDAYATLHVRFAKRLDFLPLPPDIPHLFNRAVFFFKYDDTATLTSIMDTLLEVNGRAMNIPDATLATLATIRLTPEQRDIMQDKDVITGFSLVDEKYRMVVLEGLSVATMGPEGGMALLKNNVKRTSENNAKFKILFDESVTFHERKYMNFDVDLKTVKLITPLSEMAKSLDMYFNKSVPAMCYQGFDLLMKLRSAPRLRYAHSTNLFPDVPHLLALEKRYGAFVSDEDLFGLGAKKEKKGKQMLRQVSAGKNRGVRFDDAESDDRVSVDEVKEKKEHMSRNEAYLTAIVAAAANRDTLDFEKQNKRRTKYHAVKGRGHAPFPDLYAALGGEKELEIDEEATQRLEERLIRAKEEATKYTGLEKSFSILGHRTEADYYRHPHRPDDATIEELRYPWDPPEKVNSGKDFERMDRFTDFNSVPCFNKEFGDPGNAMWGKSVFVQTDEETWEEEVGAVLRARKKWAERVVVTDPRFHVNRQQDGRKKPSQLDRTRGILTHPAQTKGLKFNKRMLKSGRLLGPIVEPPTSIMTGASVDPGLLLGRTYDAELNRSLHPSEFRPVYRKARRQVNHDPHISELSELELSQMRTIRISRPGDSGISSGMTKDQFQEWKQKALPSSNY